MRSPVRVIRRTLRGFLIVALLAAAAFALWSWLRPYAWNPDPAARCKIIGAQVRKDLAYFWVDMHLETIPGRTHDLLKPVRLITGSGKEIEPADTTLGGGPDGGTTDLWLKFWLEPGDIDGTLILKINDGTLVIKADQGLPALGPSNVKYFLTQHW